MTLSAMLLLSLITLSAIRTVAADKPNVLPNQLAASTNGRKSC